jgi:hypothetical protein
MEDENGGKGLNLLHLLDCLARAGLADLHRSRLRDVIKCVLNGVY